MVPRVRYANGRFAEKLVNQDCGIQSSALHLAGSKLFLYFLQVLTTKPIDHNISVYKINEYCRFWEKYKQKSDVVMSDLAV